MKITDKGHFTQIELETETGQANYLGSVKNSGDHRSWARDPETQEMHQYIASNQTTSQFVVKVGDTYSKV
jgi:hypothetical protein